MATKARRVPIKLDSVKLNVLGVEGTWVADEAQQRAAWELYIELVTRIAVERLAEDEGLVREAYSSLYSLFAETRAILKRAGPDVAIPKGKGNLSLAVVAVAVLNDVLRPFLAYWHPRLLAHEQRRPADRSTREHERAWPEHALARQALDGVREKMSAYADLLAQAAGIAPFHGGDEA